MTILLLDINVILDVWQERHPHYEASARLLGLCEKNKIKGLVSAASYGVLHYISTKSIGPAKTKHLLMLLKSITHVAALDDSAIEKALASGFSDFEDALQYYSGLACGAQAIITRNKRDFRKAKIPVLTPEEFFAR